MDPEWILLPNSISLSNTFFGWGVCCYINSQKFMLRMNFCELIFLLFEYYGLISIGYWSTNFETVKKVSPKPIRFDRSLQQTLFEGFQAPSSLNKVYPVLMVNEIGLFLKFVFVKLKRVLKIYSAFLRKAKIFLLLFIKHFN